MFETLKRLYNSGSLGESGLENAVNKGWITNEQKQEIMSTK